MAMVSHDKIVYKGDGNISEIYQNRYDVSDDNELNSLFISLFLRTSCMDLEI